MPGYSESTKEKVMKSIDELGYHPNAIARGGDVGSIWTIVKQLPNYMVIQLINLVGLEDDYWEHVKKNRPEAQHDIECTVLLEKELEGIYWASSDDESIEPEKLSYEIFEQVQGKAAKFVISKLEIWDMVYIEWRT